jgi:hypothetical protein
MLWWRMVRFRCCVPYPQLFEHVVHAPNTLTTQCVGHAVSSQLIVSEAPPDERPPHCDALTSRRRVFVPGPHVVSHGPQDDQSPAVPSTGQQNSLHDETSRAWGQILPPASCTVILRTRCCCPTPQVSVHDVHAPQSPMAQSDGHGAELQSCVAVLAGHAAPPNCGCVTLRVRVELPPPQDLVHVCHEPQSSITQS